MITLTFIITIWNASKLQQAIDNRTKSYVADVTLQLSDDIDVRLTNVINNLKQIESELVQFYKNSNTDDIRAFLQKYVTNLAFNEVVSINKNGKIYQTSETAENYMNLVGIQKSLQGKNGVTFLNNQSILYSIPVLDNGDSRGSGRSSG